jgi:hypothetical protein
MRTPTLGTQFTCFTSTKVRMLTHPFADSTRWPTLDVLQMYWWDYDKRYYVDMFLKAQQFVTSSRQATSAPQVLSIYLLY